MTSLAKHQSGNAAAKSEEPELLTVADVERELREAAETEKGAVMIDCADAERLGLMPSCIWTGEPVTDHAPGKLEEMAERYGLAVSGPCLPPEESDADLYYLVMAPRAA
jgi:hypothetical protein